MLSYNVMYNSDEFTPPATMFYHNCLSTMAAAWDEHENSTSDPEAECVKQSVLLIE